LENFLQKKKIIAFYDVENMASKTASKEIYFSSSVILTLHIATTTIRRLLYIYFSSSVILTLHIATTTIRRLLYIYFSSSVILTLHIATTTIRRLLYIYFSSSVILTLHIATTTIRRLLYIYVEKLHKCLYRILPRWNYFNICHCKPT